MAHRNFGQLSYGGGGGYNMGYIGGGGVYNAGGMGGYDKRSGYGGGSKGFNYDDNYRQNRDRHNMGGRGGGNRRGGGGSRRRSRSPGHRSHADSLSSRRDVPHQNRNRVQGKYEVKIPKALLDHKEVSISNMKPRYNRMYIPSDFFHGDLRWQEVFPMHQPMKLGYHADFHIFHKDVEPALSIERPTEIDPEDADFTFSAKVMLMACPPLAELYQRSCFMADEGSSYASEKMPAVRQISFLVGSGGKNEPMAIGGPWSPSLDGPNPEEDPQVLINTAIRTCKALTGVDLSGCTQWFRFLELHYFRPAERHAPPTASTEPATKASKEARVETVVVFIPDVWSCMPTDASWTEIKQLYGDALEKRIKPPQAVEPEADANATAADQTMDDSAVVADTSASQEEEEVSLVSAEGDPTHHSKLDLKTLKVADMKKELDLRKLSSSGLKIQLQARLQKALEDEALAEKKQTETKEAAAKQEEKPDGDKSTDDADSKPVELSEKDRRRIERLYRLGDNSTIIVHPNHQARGGKFDCHKMSLHALLDYRIEDQKEHTFEVSLFAEQFHEMMLRDSAFSIYKSIVVAPEKEESKEETKEDGDNDIAEPVSKRRRSDSVSPKPEEDVENTVRKIKRTVETHLLFSFNYYDTGCVDYILERDLEEIIQMLGLNLSRSQVRKLISKLPNRKDHILYRTLTDKEIIEGTENDITHLTTALDDLEYILELSQGNKALFDEAPKLIPARTIIGASADSSSLLDKLEKSENIKMLIQTQFDQLKIELEKTRKNFNTTKDGETKLNDELQSLREKLRNERRIANESRQLNSTYARLLKMARDQTERITHEIQMQFDKEKEEKEREKAEKEKEREAKKAAEAEAKGETEKSECKTDDTKMEAEDALPEDITNGDVGTVKKDWEVLDSV